MIKRLSFVLRLIDGCLNRVLLSSEAVIWINDVKYRHIYKNGGYFAAADLPEGEYSVVVSSSKFQTETLTINVDYNETVSAESRVHYLVLNPSASHPDTVRYPSISGKAVGVQKLYIMRSKSKMKIAEDGAESGRSSLKLFCEGARPQLPSLFRIKDRAAARSEIVTLSGADGDVYMLEEPLAFSHSRSSAVIPLIRISCSESGDFFFVIPPEFRPDKDSGKINLNAFAECGGVLLQTELAAESCGNTALGNIRLTNSGKTKSMFS